MKIEKIKYVVVLMVLAVGSLYSGERRANRNELGRVQKELRWADGGLQVSIKKTSMEGIETQQSVLNVINRFSRVRTFTIDDYALLVVVENTMKKINLLNNQTMITCELLPEDADKTLLFGLGGQELYINEDGKWFAYNIRKKSRVQVNEDILSRNDNFIILNDRKYRVSPSYHAYIYQQEEGVVFGNFHKAKVFGVIQNVESEDFEKASVSDRYVGLLKDGILSVYGEE